jgi:Flp pilus assembly protein TadB
MSDTLATFLLTWLCWWALLSVTYVGLLFAADALLTAWQRRQEAQRRHRAAIARIDRDTEVAVARLGAAFVVAQQLVREEAAANRSGRR